MDHSGAYKITIDGEVVARGIIKGVKMREYKSREYCKDIGCHVYKDHKLYGTTKENLRTYCNNCKAYKFHQWLKENGYKIIREVENE